VSVTPLAVQLTDLRFRYRGGPEVLDIASFEVPRGQSVFLHGPSGSGKTTLLGVIAGVLVPTHVAAYRVLGQDLRHLSPGARDALRGTDLGYLFQLFNLLPWLSVEDNVTLPVALHPARRRRLGDEPPARAARHLLERLGLGAVLHRPVSELSVGQQQRVAAARALIGRPALVIADEPTSALDTAHRDAFLDLLFEECRAVGATLLFVSHDLGLGRRFDACLSLPAINHAATTVPC
jgi:putative ABC transport system ATP-binding protein